MNRSSAGPSSSVTEPGETQPLLSASTCHCSAFTPAESGSLKTGWLFSSNSSPPIARVSRYQGVTLPSVAAIGIVIGESATPLALRVSSA